MNDIINLSIYLFDEHLYIQYIFIIFDEVIFVL